MGRSRPGIGRGRRGPSDAGRRRRHGPSQPGDRRIGQFAEVVVRQRPGSNQPQHRRIHRRTEHAVAGDPDDRQQRSGCDRGRSRFRVQSIGQQWCAGGVVSFDGPRQRQVLCFDAEQRADRNDHAAIGHHFGRHPVVGSEHSIGDPHRWSNHGQFHPGRGRRVGVGVASGQVAGGTESDTDRRKRSRRDTGSRHDRKGLHRHRRVVGIGVDFYSVLLPVRGHFGMHRVAAEFGDDFGHDGVDQPTVDAAGFSRFGAHGRHVGRRQRVDFRADSRGN